MEQLKEILNSLEKEITNPDFQKSCEVVTTKIKALDTPQEAIQPLLCFMNQHPHLNYGMPGAFVHFIESFPETMYADFLIEAIKQQPTEHNTWMLLRIMNTWKSTRQEEYIAIMKDTLLNNCITEALKQTLVEDLQDFI